MADLRRLLCLLAAVGFFHAAVTSEASAQEVPILAEPAGVPQERAPSAVDKASITKRLIDARNGLENLEARSGNDHDVQRASRLQKISTLLEAQLALVDRVDRPTASTDAALKELSDQSPSALTLNTLYETRRNLKLLEESDKALATRRKESLSAAESRLESADRARRRARSARDEATGAARQEAQDKYELLALASQIAQEEVNLAVLEMRSPLVEHATASDLAMIDEQISRIRELHARGEGDKAASLAALTVRENELRRLRESSGRRLATIELRLSAAEHRFARDGATNNEALAEAEALTELRDVVQAEIALIEAQSERLDSQRKVWQIWTSILNGQRQGEDAQVWAAELASRLDALEQMKVRAKSRAADRERFTELLDLRLGGLPGDTYLREVLNDERDALSRLQAALLSEVRAIGEDQRLTERALADLRGESGYFDLEDATARVRGVIADTWNYELIAIDDSPITVGALILAIILFAVSVRVSNWGSSLVRGLAEKRFALHPGGAQAFQTLTFYVLLVGFGLMALRAIHFPLTAFTFLGGALAIGVGFGSQNVMNNFISGLILMLERPVRAQDMVEVDGNHGIIEHIGARSTQIRSTDGRHIIVPNSFFLESNVVNWTLSDDLIRTSVVVGVIYGSPTRLVEELIQRVVDENEEILGEPAPIILFSEFGDNALNFEVHFWVRARSPMATRKVESRIRFEIDDLFREHELVIAFPQRDVHLDSVSPIEVKLTGRDGSE